MCHYRNKFRNVAEKEIIDKFPKLNMCSPPVCHILRTRSYYSLVDINANEIISNSVDELFMYVMSKLRNYVRRNQLFQQII